MKPSDPNFNIKFVEAVERRECIWNVSLKEYSKREVTNKAWREIANELNESVSVCRERWRNIRTAFLNSQKKSASGSSVKSKSPYYLSKHLQFLMDVNPHCETSENSKLCEGNEKAEVEEGDDNSESVIQNSNINVDDESSKTQNDLTRSSVNKKRPRKRKLQNSMSEAEAILIEWMRESKNEDEDLLFFKSVLPDVKKLDDNKRRTFRLKVMKMLDDLIRETNI